MRFSFNVFGYYQRFNVNTNRSILSNVVCLCNEEIYQIVNLWPIKFLNLSRNSFLICTYHMITNKITFLQYNLHRWTNATDEWLAMLACVSGAGSPGFNSRPRQLFHRCGMTIYFESCYMFIACICNFSMTTRHRWNSSRDLWL